MTLSSEEGAVMIRLLSLAIMLLNIFAQQLTTLTQPPYIETETLLINPNPWKKDLFTYTTTASFTHQFNRTPSIYFSLITLNTLATGSNSTILQKAYEVSQTSFTQETTIGMTVLGSISKMNKLRIMYLAYDFQVYPFIECNQMLVTPSPNLPQNQYQFVNYLSNSSNSSSSLNSSHSYLLNSMLSGYKQMILNDVPWLYIDTIYYDKNSYLLNIQTQGLTVKQLQILRILIDTTEMESRATKLSDLVCDTGTIVHVSDPNVIQSNPSPDYLPFAMLYGIKGWQSYDFDLYKLVYIFTNSNSRIQANIGYLLFQTRTCPSDQGYVASENLCYSLSAAFYYQLTPQTMAPCPYTCYMCAGPLTTQCRSCVQGWNRYLSGGKCICLPGFYDPGGPICLNCTQAISGCYTCNSATNCLTCLSGCTAIGFSPIYCDCPGHIQANFSFNCPQNFYYEHDSDQCLCYPQTYLDSSWFCFPCSKGCYICVKAADYCLVCIDGYKIVGTSCLFFYDSYVLLGQRSGFNSPEARCLRWDSSKTVCIQTCSQYYYQYNCYGSCPTATFPITSPWLTCQPCKISCQLCYNFTVCYQCKSNYFYFNSTTFACQTCSDHCSKCLNNTYCTKCQPAYNLVNNTCTVTQVAVVDHCGLNCSICLIGQCIGCQAGYFLNKSEYRCQQCSTNSAFEIDVDKQCVQTCGDGIVIYSTCDDGNMNSGDGCTENCQIEQGFNCRIYKSKSYCWNIAVGVQWQLYSVLGANQFILEFTSPADFTLTLHKLRCSFNHAFLNTKVQLHSLSFQIQYHQPLLLPMDMKERSTYSHISGVNTTNRCYLEIDNLINYTIIVNTVPESLFLNYNEGFQAIAEAQWLKTAATSTLYACLAVAIIGVAPGSAFVTIRIAMLMLVSYLDYYQMPINSFSAFQSLQSLTFVPSITNTKPLKVFDNDYYFALLWRAVCLYCCTFILQQFVIHHLADLIDSMDWRFLARLTKQISNNKHLIFQYVYTTYEMVYWYFLLKVASNIGQSSPGLLFFATALLALIVLTKIHLFFTVSTLIDTSPYMCHSIFCDQFQNISIALLLFFSSKDISYSPITFILFSIYNISSLLLSQKIHLVSKYHLSEKLSLWQYALSLLLFIIVQICKCTSMWRTVSSNYESLAITLGVIINLLSSATILLNGATTTVGTVLRLYQISLQSKQQNELASSQSATVGNSSVQS